MEIINDLVIEAGTKPVIIFNPKNKVLEKSKISIFQGDNVVWEGIFSEKETDIYLPTPEREFTKYQMEIAHQGKKREIHFTVLQLKKDEPYIICDIDFTISATNVFLYLTENLLKIEKIYHSREVLHELSKNIKIIYLTGRIIKYANMTKKWLHMNGYPDGPLISRAYSIPYNLEEFKKNSIENIVKINKNGIGIGDLKSDILAYQANNIVAIRIMHPLFSYSKKDNYNLKNNHYIVNSWKGIEKLFNEKKLV